MTRTIKLSIVTILLCASALVAIVFALFNGYFDRGKFEVKEAKVSPARQVAMLVKRSDHEALNGDEYFVLIGDHVLSPTEIIHSFYSKAAVFTTDRDCLTLNWNDSDKLVVTCKGGQITPDQIVVQHDRTGRTAVSYINIVMIQSDKNN